MNKKLFGIIGAIVLLVLLIVCCSINPGDKSSNDSESTLTNAINEASKIKEKEQKEFTEINIDEYLNIYNGEERKIVLIARPTCQYCQIADPILKNLAYKYNISINYLNIDNFQEDDAQKFIESNEFFGSNISTPMLLIVSNGKINDMIDGVTDTRHYTEFLKENNFINVNY